MDELGTKIQSGHIQRQKDQHQTKAHDELLIGLDRVQRATVASGMHQIAALQAHKPEVTVSNHPESISTPDVDKVVKVINELIKVEKGKREADLKPIIKQLVKIVPILEELPSKIVMPEAKEEVEVSNFDEVTIILEDILLSLKSAAEREAAEPPLVIPAPLVTLNEKEVDLTPIQSDLQDIRAAVDNIRIPEPIKDDDTPVIEAVMAVYDAISNLRFPVPNVPNQVTATSNGTQVLAVANPDGTNVFSGGSISVATAPTFKADPTSGAETAKYGKVDSDYLLMTGKIFDYQIADEDSATTTKYFGFLKPSGKWYILRQIVGTTNSYRWANLSNNATINAGTATAYGNAVTTNEPWTNRATLVYGQISSLTGL